MATINLNSFQDGESRISDSESEYFLSYFDKSPAREVWNKLRVMKTVNGTGPRESIELVFRILRLVEDRCGQKYGGDGDRGEYLSAVTRIRARRCFWNHVLETGLRHLEYRPEEMVKMKGGRDGLVYTEDGKIALYCADRDVRQVTLRPGTKAVACGAFAGLRKLESVNFNEGLEYIGEVSFWGAENLREISFPQNGPLYIDQKAFESCKSIVSLVIPPGVSFIREGTFWGCSSLENLELPDTLSDIGPLAFSDTALKHVCLPKYLLSISGTAFEGVGVTTEAEFRFLRVRHGLLMHDDKVMGYNGTDCSVVIPQNVTVIGDGAFYGSHIWECVLPAGIRLIDREAFEGCRRLKEISCRILLKKSGTVPSFAPDSRK